MRRFGPQLVVCIVSAGMIAAVLCACITPASRRGGLHHTPALPQPATVPSAIAFDAQRVFMAHAHGDTPVPVAASDGATCYDACWSPEGRRLCFTREPSAGGAAGLVVAGTAGRERRALTTPAAGRDASPDWSPRGDRVAFIRQAGSSGSGLATVEVATGKVRMLVRGRDVHSPSWSPDGTRLMYSAGATPEKSWLYVISADGGDPRPLHLRGTEPDWCPTDNRLACAWADDIWNVALDWQAAPVGRPVKAVSRAPGFVHGHPSWSPDGNRLAFEARARTERGWQSRIMTLDTAVGNDALCIGYGRRPDWSPGPHPTPAAAQSVAGAKSFPRRTRPTPKTPALSRTAPF